MSDTKTVSIAVGAGLAGLAVYLIAGRSSADAGAPGGSCATPALVDKHGTLSSHDGVRPCAHPGIASNPKFVWFISGSNASQIAKDITGDDRRFVELIAANPEKATKGNPASPYSSGYNFQSLGVNEPIRMPFTWNVFVDETGAFSAPGVPFPTG